MKRAAMPGEFSRAEKEMVAAAVSGVNACEY
jgi:AhpD family alkylhydroperoxidase